MNLPSLIRIRLAQSLAPALQRWHRLEQRHQRVIGIGALLLMVAILFAYVWLPAVRERDRLTARLPQLSAQLALMKTQADEIRQLTSTSLIAPAPPTIANIDTLQSAFGDGARVNLDPSRAFRVVIPRIVYATWWDRLGDMQSRHQLQIISLTLQALPDGRREVSVDMLMADQTRPSGSPAAGAGK